MTSKKEKKKSGNTVHLDNLSSKYTIWGICTGHWDTWHSPALTRARAQTQAALNNTLTYLTLNSPCVFLKGERVRKHAGKRPQTLGLPRELWMQCADQLLQAGVHNSDGRWVDREAERGCPEGGWSLACSLFAVVQRQASLDCSILSLWRSGGWLWPTGRRPTAILSPYRQTKVANTLVRYMLYME